MSHSNPSSTPARGSAGITPRWAWFLVTVSMSCVCLPGHALRAQEAGGVGVEDLHSPEARYQFAEGLFFRKFYDLAEKEFRVFVTQYPGHELAPDAMYRLIISLRNQGKEDETLSAINQFQARWPDHELISKLFLWKGELLFERGKFAAAEYCFRRLLDSDDPKVTEAGLFFMAQCLEKQDKSDEALAAYQKLAEEPFEEGFEYRPYAVFAIGLANQRRGKSQAAADAFSRLADADTLPAGLREEALYRFAEALFAQELYDRAATVYTRLLAEVDDGAFAREARKRLCWAYYLQGKYARAAEVAGEWRDLYGDAFDPQLDYIHAASLVGVEFYEEALPMLRKLVDDPRVSDRTMRMANYQVIICLANLQRHEELIEACNAFAERFPKSSELPTVWYLAGRASHTLGQYEQAIPMLRRAIEGFVGEWPYYADAVKLLTESLEKLQRYSDAAEVYREAAAQEELDDRPYLLYKAGECARKSDNRKAAIQDFEALLKQFPGAADETRAAMQQLGELYSSAGEFNRASDIVTKLLEQSATERGNARLRFFLGYLQYQQDNYKAAADQFKAALQESDSGTVAASAKFYLGGALLELEQLDEALNVFGEVLSLPQSERPDFPPDLLFQLDELYYARNQYHVSEAICRWLMTREDGRTVYRAALRLADILAAQSRLAEAVQQLADLRARLAAGELTFEEAPERPLESEIACVQAEIFLLQDKVAKAVVTAQDCLSEEGLDAKFVTRARWVMGEALFRQGQLEEALRYAVKVYILADDPVYSPRAMVLALEILIAQDKLHEGSRTWQELRTRYPIYAESVTNKPAVKTMMEFEASEQRGTNAEREAPTQEPQE